jgi:hypothetical protein
MPSSGMWRSVGLVRTDVSEECLDDSVSKERIHNGRFMAYTGLTHISMIYFLDFNGRAAFGLRDSGLLGSRI